MGGLLLISDDLARTTRLARTIRPGGPCSIHDLYAEATPATEPDLIVGDVAQLSSEAIVRLRRLLEPLRAAGAPFLLLTHGNATRAEVQARLLAPTDILPALSVLERLLARIDRLLGRGLIKLAARPARLRA